MENFSRINIQIEDGNISIGFLTRSLYKRQEIKAKFPSSMIESLSLELRYGKLYIQSINS